MMMNSTNFFSVKWFVLPLFFCSILYSQNIEISKELYEELLEVRSYLYHHPEESGHEKATATYVAKYLKEIGLEVKTNIGGYGVIGILKGYKKGRRVAWRADMDAICKPNYLSENNDIACNVAHICGHDVHTTIALGMAKVLANQKNKIEGTVYFIFQPSEENWKGAKAMMTDSLFEIIHPDEIYGAHISPMPVGLIATKSGYIYADYKQINLAFKNIKDVDELLKYVKDCCSQLQTISEDSPFWKMENLLKPDIGIGNPNTIFKEYITVEDHFEVKNEADKVTISAYVSASNADLMNKIPNQLKQKIQQSSYAKRLDEIIFYSNQFGYSTERGNINNNTDLSEKTLSLLSKNSNKNYTALPLYGVIPGGRGDDFAYYQEKTPGVYFLIGGSNFEKGIIAMPHASDFKLDERVIKIGVEAFSAMVMDCVNE